MVNCKCFRVSNLRSLALQPASGRGSRNICDPIKLGLAWSMAWSTCGPNHLPHNNLSYVPPYKYKYKAAGARYTRHWPKSMLFNHLQRNIMSIMALSTLKTVCEARCQVVWLLPKVVQVSVYFPIDGAGAVQIARNVLIIQD